MKKQIHNKKSLKPFRKKLRNHGTSAEAFLWKYLQQKKLDGRKFRRQHSISNFIVDFYCPEEKLIIELDGQVHMNLAAEENDRIRTAILEGLGVTVVRFENRSVFENLYWVLGEIKSNFRPPRPSDTPP